MAIIISLDKCSAISPHCIVKIIQGGKLPKGGGIWNIENEIKPSDLYCYLYAKFGPPNGLQNLFRQDDSDNLIHWDWTLGHELGLIMILGLNLRTEIHLLGNFDFPRCNKEAFISSIKNDFGKYGKEISTFRREHLENWDIFINPYKQLNDTIEQFITELSELDLDPENENLQNPTSPANYSNFMEKMNKLMERYNKGIGLAISLRIMLPILAESFVNLVIFILCRPDIRNNKRLFDSYFKENIDVRIQSLHIKCSGFATPIDWSSEQCKKYNSIVNQRNDLLHGNIAVEKLKFSEIFFNGKVPVFKQYETMWQQSVGVSINASGVSSIKKLQEDIQEFIEYVLSCLEPEAKGHVEFILAKRDIGRNRENGRLGILLPDYLVDFGVSYIQKG